METNNNLDQLRQTIRKRIHWVRVSLWIRIPLLLIFFFDIIMEFQHRPLYSSIINLMILISISSNTWTRHKMLSEYRQLLSSDDVQLLQTNLDQLNLYRSGDIFICILVAFFAAVCGVVWAWG